MSDEVESVGDERREGSLVLVQALEELVEGLVEQGECLVRLIEQDLALEEMPKPLDQVQIGRVGGQVDKPQPTSGLGEPCFAFA